MGLCVTEIMLTCGERVCVGVGGGVRGGAKTLHSRPSLMNIGSALN